MKTVAIVPARGGSKGVPRKNLVKVAGRPLLAWTVEAAVEAKLIDRVILTTDSEEIAAIGRHFGAETPFMRPLEMAGDATPMIDSILHAVGWLDLSGYKFDCVMCLQPTSPLRTTEDIDAACRMMALGDDDGVVSVCEASNHPLWVKRVTCESALTDYIEQEDQTTRRQDLPKALALNGAIFLAKRSVLETHRTWYTSRTRPYLMPPERSLDIDTPWDMRLADLILRERES